MNDTIYVLIKDTLSTINITNDKIIGISIDSLATIVITITVFGLGILSRNYYERKKDEKRLRNILQYFKSNISNMIITSEKEIDSLNDIIKQINEKYDADLFFLDNSSISFDFFNKISHVDLFNIFIKYSVESTEKEKIDKFILISNDVKSLEYLIKHSKDTFSHFYELIQKYSDFCNNSFKQIAYLINDYKKYNIQYLTNPDDDLFLSEIIALALQLKKEEKPSDLNIQYEIFILPLIDLCNRYKKELRAPEVIKHAMEYRYYYENKNKIKQIMVKVFMHNTELIKQIILDFNEIDIKLL